jgi:trehalose 6-phosphate synthase/phosphatase
MPATISLVDVSPCDNFVSPDLEMYTCTVGKKPSAAANYVHDVQEVQELLDSLVKVSTRDQKFYSAIDLTSYSSVQATANNMQALQLNSLNSNPDMLRSMSLDQVSAQDDAQNQAEVRVSTNLNDFLGNLGTIEDDDDDDAFFF